MKIGIRKPSIKKRIKARTTAKIKREIKGSINPLYGKKGMGWVNDPKKAMYNKVYNKTTISVDDLVEKGMNLSSVNIDNSSNNNQNRKEKRNKVLLIIVAIFFLPYTVLYFLIKYIYKCFKLFLKR